MCCPTGGASLSARFIEWSYSRTHEPPQVEKPELISIVVLSAQWRRWNRVKHTKRKFAAGRRRKDSERVPLGRAKPNQLLASKTAPTRVKSLPPDAPPTSVHCFTSSLCTLTVRSLVSLLPRHKDFQPTTFPRLLSTATAPRGTLPKGFDRSFSVVKDEYTSRPVPRQQVSRDIGGLCHQPPHCHSVSVVEGEHTSDPVPEQQISRDPGGLLGYPQLHRHSISGCWPPA